MQVASSHEEQVGRTLVANAIDRDYEIVDSLFVVSEQGWDEGQESTHLELNHSIGRNIVDCDEHSQLVCSTGILEGMRQYQGA